MYHKINSQPTIPSPHTGYTMPDEERAIFPHGFTSGYSQRYGLPETVYNIARPNMPMAQPYNYLYHRLYAKFD